MKIVEEALHTSHQVRALLNKSVTLQFRQYATNICQLAFPIIILLFIYILQLIVNTIFVVPSPFNVEPPVVQLSPIILAMLSNPVNYTFTIPTEILYSTEPYISNATIGYLNATRASSGLLGNIPISPYGQLPYTNFSNNPSTIYVPYFTRTSSQEETNVIFFDKLDKFGSRLPLTELASIHIWDLNVTSDFSLGYNLQWDSAQTPVTPFCTQLTFFGGCNGLIPSALMNLLNSVYIRNLTNNNHFVFANTKQMPYVYTAKGLIIADFLGAFFFPLILSFLLPVFMYTLVLEKQGKLREMMKLTGMKMRNYICVNYLVFFTYYIVILVEFLILCFIFQFRAITQTSPAIIAIAYIGWGLCLVSWAFFLSAFISKTLIAVVLGYLLTIFGTTAGVILSSQVFQKGDLSYKPVYLINPLALTDVIYSISIACNKLTCPGVEALWMDREIQIGIIAIYFNALWYLIVGLYIDAVIPQQWGISKPWYFPIQWMWSCCKRKNSDIPKNVYALPENEDGDVIKEREKVLSGEKTSENCPILIQSLHKKYNRKKTALHELTIAMENGECFGLLGPNGAGKTTTISMLCGLFGPSYGTAYVNGFDIRTDMDSVHLSLGLCPQFDILWDDLTCEEHLLFYARLKGTPLLEESKEVEKVLKSVGLWEKRSKKSGALSGGMKRRLSIAISFVGNPSVIMLDEPTTGLDPTSKRNLWDAILAEKKGKCIVLTTHSMEEADVLCNRIGIVCRGRLKCIGSSLHLKNKFGQGFTLAVNFKEGKRQDAYNYILKILPQAKLHTEFKGNMLFEIEKQYIKVSRVFKQIESEKENSGILDCGLSQTSLEDVFLNIVRKDEEIFIEELEKEKIFFEGKDEPGMPIVSETEKKIE